MALADAVESLVGKGYCRIVQLSVIALGCTSRSSAFCAALRDVIATLDPNPYFGVSLFRNASLLHVPVQTVARLGRLHEASAVPSVINTAGRKLKKKSDFNFWNVGCAAGDFIRFLACAEKHGAVPITGILPEDDARDACQQTAAQSPLRNVCVFGLEASRGKLGAIDQQQFDDP